MKVVAAYLLAALGGKEHPTANDITHILSSVHIEADSERVEALLKELEGKNVNEVVAAGLSKLASVPAGGAVAVSGGAAAAAVEEAPKEEAKKEESEEEDADMGFSLFD